MYYRNANCAVVVYDITQTSSLDKAKTWIRELQRQADPAIVIALCGNKTDLEARRQVTKEEAQKYAEEEGLLWFETSAKSGTGVSEVFTSIGTCGLYLFDFHSHIFDVLTTRNFTCAAATKLPKNSAPAARPGAAASSTPQRRGGGVDLNNKPAGAQGQDACNC